MGSRERERDKRERGGEIEREGEGEGEREREMFFLYKGFLYWILMLGVCFVVFSVFF